MPNFKTTTIKELNFPIKEGEFTFEYIASSKKNSNEKLILVSYQNQRFFLQQIKREKDYLIKAEKLSKINSTAIIHKALQIYSKLIEAKITFSNITPKKEKKPKETEFLKNIDFFINRKFEQPLSVEVGFGSGRHLLYQARNNPKTLYIGLEIHKPSIEQVLNLIKIENLKNILILDYDVREFLEILNSNSVSRIFVHFPVPWDKKPHRRVISQEFLDEAVRVLTLSGTLELRTDSIKYYNYSSNLMTNLKDVEVTIKKNASLKISSKYEDRWKRQNRDIFDIIVKNKVISKLNEDITSLEFKESFNVNQIWKKFKDYTYREGDTFIHLENIYKQEGRLIIKLSFGRGGKSEHKYIVIEDRVYYFPTSTISTKSNKKIHNKIKELLNE